MRHQIICRDCEKPIQNRSELLILGRSLAPVHEACRRSYNAAQPWYLRSWAINRRSSFIKFNLLFLMALAVAALLRPDVSLQNVFIIIAFANCWLIVGRIICRFLIERHIPEA